MAKRKKVHEVKKILKEHEKELKNNYGVKTIGIFGSYIRGEETSTSDIDILIEFMPDAEMDLIKFVELENYLSEITGINVDLVMKTALKPEIGKNILNEVVYL